MPPPPPASPARSGARRASTSDVKSYLLGVATAVLGVVIFTLAFFPNNIEMASPGSSSEEAKVEDGGRRDRVILMLVDALRTDFVWQDNSSFPFTMSRVSSGEAVAFTTRAHPPTVTLPRLKAIITGDIPGFLDIVANFNSKEMAQDNIISRARAAGKKVTMFGDETWLKLFPNSFHRSDGTTAFYVMDTRIVDDNVTRHVLPELEEDDWDMMVLHYLGLDHAGHVSGAESALMRSKQAEMDELVRVIHGKLSQQAAGGGRRTALVVASDHGMNAQGNHGGATNDERDACAIFFPTLLSDVPPRRRGQGKGVPFPVHLQVDMAPTLSLLMGIGVPRQSIGSALPDGVLDHLSPRTLLSGLERNAAQLSRLLGSAASERGLEQGLAAARSAAGECLKREGVDGYGTVAEVRAAGGGAVGGAQCVIEAEGLYREYMTGASRELEESQGVQYDVPGLLLGLLTQAAGFAVLATLSQRLCVQRERGGGGDKAEFPWWALAAAGAVVGGGGHYAACGWIGQERGVCEKDVQNGVTVTFAYALVLLCISCIVGSMRGPYNQLSLMGLELEHVVSVGGLLLHLASLGGSSMVEEEHQTFYFLTATLSLCAARRALRAVADGVRGIDAWRPLVAVGMLMICSRVQRSWNQTGVKYAGADDITKSLHAGGLIHAASLVPLAAVLLVLWPLTGRVSRQVGDGRAIRSLRIFLCLLVPSSLGLWHWVTWWGGSVQEVWAARAVFVAGIVCALSGILLTFISRRGKDGHGGGVMEASGVLCFVGFSVFIMPLHQQHNYPVLVLFGIQAACLVVIARVGREAGGGVSFAMLVMLDWMGRSGYFNLGNSNSLASIDISKAYTGLTDYYPPVVGTFTLLITFTAPLLFWLCTIVCVGQNCHGENGGYFSGPLIAASSLHSAIRSGCILFFCTVAVFMRNHLFVWSVFAPKLLYEFLLFNVMVAAHASSLLLDCALDMMVQEK